ncbi:MAG: hypothetical protein ABFS32_12890 [Bacteroidota bacterium]
MCSLPIYVSILIAGADGKIDNHEIKKAISLASLKTKKERRELVGYYQQVARDFEDKLKMMIANLPSETKKREKILIEEIGRANEVFPKMDKKFTVKLYLSLKDLAKSIAEASGGVFGYMSVGYEESRLIDLKMIKKPSK